MISKRLNALLVSATIIVSGCIANPPIKDKPLTGAWQGIVQQNGPGNHRAEYPVKIALEGLKGGTVDYPSLRCGGRLEYSGMRGNVPTYREIILVGQNRCINNGLVTINAINATQVEFRVTVSGAVVIGTLGSLRN